MRGQEDAQEEEEVEDHTPSNIEVLKALKVVRKFAQLNTLNNEINALSNIERTLTNSFINSKKLTDIKHYFN